MTTIDTAAMRERTQNLLDGITPGPWGYHSESVDPNWHIITPANRMRVLANVHIEPGNEMDASNARLITAAPDLAADNLRLCDENERLLAENERLREALDVLMSFSISDHIDPRGGYSVSASASAHIKAKRRARATLNGGTDD